MISIRNSRVPRDWKLRWQASGGKLYNGRMIAEINSPIWKNISRFDLPYPPFDFNSEMGVVDIERSDAIKLGLLPEDEPADEIPDFDCVLETEVSLDRIPEEFREQIIKETPNAEIRDNKLVQQNKPKLPTWKDIGLESAKTWKHQGIKDKTVDSEEARKRLAKGEVVKDVFGEDATFNNAIITHWEEVGKTEKDIKIRLTRIDVAEEVVKKPHEVWQQGSQKMYIQIYEKDSGKIKGMAVAKQGDLIIRSYILNSPQGLNATRKGKRIYPK